MMLLRLLSFAIFVSPFPKEAENGASLYKAKLAQSDVDCEIIALERVGSKGGS